MEIKKEKDLSEKNNNPDRSRAVPGLIVFLSEFIT